MKATFARRTLVLVVHWRALGVSGLLGGLLAINTSTILWGGGLKRCDVPATREPSRLLIDDGKRPNGLTLVPWQKDRCLTWHATVVDSLASSYLSATSSLPGSAAESAAARERSKYAAITLTHIFIPISIETLGPVNAEGLRFFWIKLATGCLPLPGTHGSRPFYIKCYM